MSESEYNERGMRKDDKPGVMTMRTYTGKHVDPMNVTVDDIDIIDIAHALSRQCRFNGHCHGYLSVARHCVEVSHRLEYAGKAMALCGLLHDAAETYIGDLIRPLKYNSCFDAYFEAEERIERVIAEKFGLAYPMPDEVKDADNASVIRELEELWEYVGNPVTDARDFLDRFMELYP